MLHRLIIQSVGVGENKISDSAHENEPRHAEITRQSVKYSVLIARRCRISLSWTVCVLVKR